MADGITFGDFVRQRQRAGETGMSILELKLLTIMDTNRKLVTPLILAYRAGKAPPTAAQEAFMALPAVYFLRGEYTDVQIVSALARAIETVLQQMGA